MKYLPLVTCLLLIGCPSIQPPSPKQLELKVPPDLLVPPAELKQLKQ